MRYSPVTGLPPVAHPNLRVSPGRIVEHTGVPQVKPIPFRRRRPSPGQRPATRVIRAARVRLSAEVVVVRPPQAA